MSTNRHVSRFECPRYEGEDILNPPKMTDDRLVPWLRHLKEEGVIVGDLLTVAVPNFRLMRGVGPGGEHGHYLFMASWDSLDVDDGSVQNLGAAEQPDVDGHFGS